MTRSRAILIGATATALISVALLLGDQAPTWLRVLLGIPLIFVLPGHALMLLVDTEERLGRAEWFALSLGGSLSITILTGMALAITPFGLSAQTMILLLALLSLALTFAAQARTPAPLLDEELPPQRTPALRGALNTMLVMACMLLVLAAAVPSADTAKGGGIVQLWGVPAKSGGVRIGAKNVNAPQSRYRIRIEQEGRLISEQEFDMPEGGGRIFEVQKAATFTTRSPIEASLSDVDAEVATRTVSVWMNR